LQCRLCRREAELRNSHIVPAFVFRWLKDTSATGYLRGAVNPNRRIQDGPKEPMLCADCEQKFSTYEKQFAENIFTKYVREDLDERGVASGRVQMPYGPWLLSFVLSVQWRIVDSNVTDKAFRSLMTAKQADSFERICETWRQFLLEKRRDSGPSDHHLIFLQSMSSAKGTIPSYIDDRIDLYLLRAADGTVVVGPSHTAVYAKLGPIAFYSSLVPQRLEKLRNTRVHMKGALTSVQHMLNPTVTGFLYRDRPTEVLDRTRHSDQQNRLVVETMKRDIPRAAKSLSRVVAVNAEIIRGKKRK
jgi:hypothetical protein